VLKCYYIKKRTKAPKLERIFMKKLFIAFTALVLIISTFCIGASAITVPSNDVVRVYSHEEDGTQMPVDGIVATEENGETEPSDRDESDSEQAASIFGEGSLTLIVALVALVASAASIVVNLASRKKENSTLLYPGDEPSINFLWDKFNKDKEA
jgi:hypothetical protein